jgi:hypothetical protein
MPQDHREQTGPGEGDGPRTHARPARRIRGSTAFVARPDADVYLPGGKGHSTLLTVAGSFDRPRGQEADLGGAALALRSWVVGWTHRLEPPGPRWVAEANPAGVRRLVEAVVDVLLERRPAEQVRRWVSREVFGLLCAVSQRRAVSRFAARSMVRSIRLHAPGPDAVESTVLVQDGPRVRAVALRFERVPMPYGPEAVEFRAPADQTDPAGPPHPADTPRRADHDTLEWRCTALQFG